MRPKAPDIVLLGTAWQPRALLRAQLIEEGFEVLAFDSWSTMRRLLRSRIKPKLAIVDLQDLEQPNQVLNELRSGFDPARVLILGALGSVAAADVERLGFRVVARPVVIQDIVAAVKRHVSRGTNL